MISQYKQELFGMVCATPKDIVKNEEEDIIWSLQMKLNEILNEEDGLPYYVVHNVKLKYIYENFDKSSIDD